MRTQAQLEDFVWSFFTHLAEEMTSLCLSESRILVRWEATESAYSVICICEEQRHERAAIRGGIYTDKNCHIPTDKNPQNHSHFHCLYLKTVWTTEMHQTHKLVLFITTHSCGCLWLLCSGFEGALPGDWSPWCHPPSPPQGSVSWELRMSSHSTWSHKRLHKRNHTDPHTDTHRNRQTGVSPTSTLKIIK